MADQFSAHPAALLELARERRCPICVPDEQATLRRRQPQRQRAGNGAPECEEAEDAEPEEERLAAVEPAVHEHGAR